MAMGEMEKELSEVLLGEALNGPVACFWFGGWCVMVKSVLRLHGEC